MRVLLATPYGPDGVHDHAAADVMGGLVGALAPHVELFVYAPDQQASTMASGATLLAGRAPARRRSRHLSVRPSWLRKEWSAAATAQVLDYSRVLRPDVIHCEYLQAAEPALAADRPSVVALHDVTTSVQRRLREASRGPHRAYRTVELARTRAFERRILGAASVVVALSPGDELTFRTRAQRVVLAQPGVPIPDRCWSPPARTPPMAVFFGALWRSANAEIASFLVDEVMPRVWAARPDVTLRIAGSRPSPRVTALAGPGVEVVGYVEDVDALLCEADVIVVPNRVGGGVLLKLLRAMASGCPAVTSPDAAAAIGAIDGEHVLVGEGAEGVASRVLEAIGHPTRAATVGAGARRLIQENFSWERTAASYLAAYHQARSR